VHNLRGGPAANPRLSAPLILGQGYAEGGWNTDSPLHWETCPCEFSAGRGRASPCVLFAGRGDVLPLPHEGQGYADVGWSIGPHRERRCVGLEPVLKPSLLQNRGIGQKGAIWDNWQTVCLKPLCAGLSPADSALAADLHGLEGAPPCVVDVAGRYALMSLEPSPTLYRALPPLDAATTEPGDFDRAMRSPRPMAGQPPR
jgi:hypothetical protein